MDAWLRESVCGRKAAFDSPCLLFTLQNVTMFSTLTQNKICMLRTVLIVIEAYWFVKFTKNFWDFLKWAHVKQICIPF